MCKWLMPVACNFLLLAWTPAWAEDDTIVTDRPDFVESSQSVGKNRFQIETSFAFEKTRDGASKQYVNNTPTLLRFGVSETVELRLETEGYMHARGTGGSGDRQSGWADTSLGVKWHTHDGEGLRPAVGWLFHTDIDSGSAAFRGKDIRPSLRAVFEWELPQDWSLGIMPGLVREKDDSGRYTAGLLGLVIGKSLNDQLRIFFEVAGHQLASDSHGGDLVTYNSGFAYLLTKMIQADFAISAGANDRSPDLAATVGLSMKF